MERTGRIDIYCVLLLAVIFIIVSGCVTQKAPPGATNITGPKNYNRSLVHDGIKRIYTIHVPPGYIPGRPVPMVMNIHGGGENSSVHL